MVAVIALTLAAGLGMVMMKSAAEDPEYFFVTLGALRSLLGCRSSCSYLKPSMVVRYLETDSHHDAVEAQQAVLEAFRIAGEVELAFDVVADSHHKGYHPRTG